MATTNALVGTLRLNNSRLNYLSGTLSQERATKVTILLNGQDIRTRVRRGSLTVRDVINDAPNSADFTMEAPPQPPYVQSVLADHPIAYWRLGDTSATAHDQTGRGHTGTLFGGVTTNQPGAVVDGDRAMGFPGVSGARIEIANAADLALTTVVMVEAWVKPESASQSAGIFTKTIGGGLSTSYSLYQDGGNWVFLAAGASGIAYVTAPVESSDVGRWTHLVAFFANTVFAIWKNAVMVAYRDDITVGPVNAGAGVCYIGHLSAGGYPFKGAIDEVAVYDHQAAFDRHYASAHASTGPTIAASVRIAIGVDDPVLLFNGALSQVALTYEGLPTQPVYRCSATDDTARANRRRPFGQFTNVSATTVAQQLIASFVPGFGSAFVQPGLPPISVIFDGSEGMNRCLTQITNLLGGYWYFLDSQLHLFLAETTDPPDPIDAAHRFLNDPPIAASTDLSQVRTRVYGRGHGENLLSAVAPGETVIPIASAVMFSPTGGRAICLAQVLTYTGCALGGSGSLVGPGAGPSVAVTVALAAGAGLGSGTYGYAYTNVTPSGESLPGPLATIAVGPLPAPAAPTVGAPTIGSGPNPGAHQYALTYLTASGETTPGPTAAATTGLTPGPTGAPTLRASSGGGPDIGAHDYVVTFMTAIGESAPSPASAQVTTFVFAAPANAPVVQQSSYAYSNPPPHRLTAGATYRYGFAFELGYGVGVTTMSPPSNPIVAHATYGVNVYINYAGLVFNNVAATSVIYYRSVNGGPFHQFNYQQGGTYQSPIYDLYTGDVDIAGNATDVAVSSATTKTIALTDIPIGDANVTGRHLWRRFNGTGPFRSLDSIPNNTATTYTDTAPNAVLGGAVPVASSAYLQRFPVTVPVGGPLVTGRKVYRTVAGGATLQLAATIADNTTTSWIDTVPDASLGAVAPIGNTATANRVTVGGIAVGAASVTARKVYRTAVNGAQLKLLATIADNVTLTYLDALSDASLGASAPTGDTSGLTQPQGQVNAGSPTIPTASAGPFPPSGWVVLGSQVVRYTGVTGNTLTGIPPSGIGALTTTVRYGDHVLSAPVLTGVTVLGPSNALTAPAGTLVCLWVQRDDLAAQAAMAARDGGDGIYEYLVQDERRAEASLTALCNAHLIAYANPIATVTYATRDIKTRSGKPIAVDLATPPIRGALVIQDVTIDEIDLAPGLAPRFSVTASSVRLSLDDLLRQLTGTLEDA